MDKLESPIIIIGAGRSGSTLLNAILDAHPEIHMHGELQFTAAMLWRCVWDVHAAANERIRRQELACQTMPAAAVQQAERDRGRDIVHDTLDRIYGLSARPEMFWGFKEIYMLSGEALDWKPYDEVFPNALYVHLIRHPFDFARSSADWHRVPLTVPYFQELLENWLTYVALNRQRAETGRYVTVTYENLVADPQAVLSPVLARLGLPWNDACAAVVREPVGPSPRRSPFPFEATEAARRIPNLERIMAEFGYEIPEPSPPPRRFLTRLVPHSVRQLARRILPVGPLLRRVFSRPAAGDPCAAVARPTRSNADAIRIDEATWQFNPPFIRHGPFGWLIDLRYTPGLAHLARLGDDSVSPERSPLRLLEDGRPLAPAHCLHATIREVGNGGYSHWGGEGHFFLFSTSDNSDPNTNGRPYTVTLAPVREECRLSI